MTATALLAGAALIANWNAQAQEQRPGGCPEGPPCNPHTASTDAIVGTWKLNLSKSRFSLGDSRKAETRVYYTESNGLYTLDQKVSSADGKEMSIRVQYRDRQDLKQASGGPADSAYAKKIDANTWDFDLKKDGRHTEVRGQGG